MRIDPAIIERVRALKLIDPEWYSQYHALEAEKPALAHFLTSGWLARAQPNPFFDFEWYLHTNPEVRDSGQDPLVHYITSGEAAGFWPSRLLNPGWYAETYKVALGGGAALSHYLDQGSREGLFPNSIFDPQAYLANNPDLPKDLRRAAIHYALHGYREARSIRNRFYPQWYRNTYGLRQDEDPIYHYLTIGMTEGNKSGVHDLNAPAHEVRSFAAAGPDFEELDRDIIKSGPARAKIIAFYLPQFHAFPENDAWWGTGFTEWRNVARGQPRFVGHHQPRIPRDLGFYDLTHPDTMPRQIELAKAAGIYGFCFYHYVFGRRTLMDAPLTRLLNDPALDIPFCLMWANENWTRRWDGEEQEVLIRQDYKEEDDDYLIESLATAMRDPRYIRIEGRPLFTIYRPGIIPDARKRIARWRAAFFERFQLKPWFLMAQAFWDHDPTIFDLDGAMEFPPHKIVDATETITYKLNILDPSFNGRVFDYEDVVKTSLSAPRPDFPLIKTAFPSWDNDARRQGHGTSVTNSSPRAYQAWMEGLIEQARSRRFAGEAIVCVNAWNEWAEGAYLEPDVRFGSAYLNATARAVTGTAAINRPDKPHVLLVGHDAHPNGAQMTLLNLGRTYVRRFGMRVSFLLLGEGALLPAYKELGDVIIASPHAHDLRPILDKLRSQGLELALTNTVITSFVVPELKRVGFRVLSLVHELPRVIREFVGLETTGFIANESDVVVFPADMVQNAFAETVGPIRHKSLILPQGLYARIELDRESRTSIRNELGLPADARIVLGLGYADLRKGIDLFLETARAAASIDPGLVFVWVGHLDGGTSTWLLNEGATGAHPANVRHVSFTPQAGRYLQAADALYLTSREDPFPSTVLEAFACGLPVVGFAGCTGTEHLIERHGTIVPAYDTAQALQALIQEVETNTMDKVEQRRSTIAEEFRWDRYAFRLLQELNPAWKQISVVVPNYNYAQYLEERLDSIFNQTVPIFELICLDDASSDESISVIDRVAGSRQREVTMIRNEMNSGSIMKQWARGATEADGEFLWIAEADDLSSPHFLHCVSQAHNGRTLLTFCDSSQIDEHGQIKARSYNYYFKLLQGSAFDRSFSVNAADFAMSHLATANLILNVSAVLFKRSALVGALQSELADLQTYRFAGDWLTYLALCRQDGEIAYVAEPLNVHRRHGGSATHQTKLEAHIEEIHRAHDAFSRLFSDAPDILKRQQIYRAEVREQFKLGSEESRY